MAKKALRDLPEAELKQRVVEALQNLQGALLRAALHTHSASGYLTAVDHPETSAAPGSALDDAAGRLQAANDYLRDAISCWEFILGRAKDKR